MSKNDKEYYYSGNSFADTLKIIAVVVGSVAVITGIIVYKNSAVIGIASIITGIAIGIFLYADVEKIDLLNDIRENSEHLRDNVNEKKWGEKCKWKN